MKLKYKAVALLVIVLSLLTVALRGAAPKTYEQTEIPASEIQTTIVSYNLQSDFVVNASNWMKYDFNINSSFNVNDNRMLFLKDDFSNAPQHQYTRLYKNLSIDISKLPIFSINISVSGGAIYHIRFAGKDSSGNEKTVWWESSPLDDIPGKSKWEYHVVDMASFSYRATSENITEITRVEVILDKPSSANGGEKQLCVSHIAFSERSLKATRIPEGGVVVSGNETIQAVIMNVPSQFMPDATWNLQMAAVTYCLTSNLSFGYRMYFLSAENGLLIDGPSFVSHEASFADIYKIEALLGESDTFSEQLSFVSSFLGNYSIVILKDEWGQSGFQTFRLDSVEVTSLKKIGGGG